MPNFQQIPLVVNQPGFFVEYDTSQKVQGPSVVPHAALLAGQKLSSGSATVGQVYKITDDFQGATLFGQDANGGFSQLGNMIAAFRMFNKQTDLYAICPAADSGTNATGSFVWTGTAAETRDLPLYIGGRRVVVPVVAGDTAAEVETTALLVLAATADLPVTFAANAAAGVDLTALQGGTIGNQIMLGVCLGPGEQVPAGLTVVTTAMSGGATDPSYAAVFTATASDQYHTHATGLASDTVLDLYETDLEARLDAMVRQDGFMFATYYDTRANHDTALASRNSAVARYICGEKSAMLPLPWEVSAAAAAIDAAQQQKDPSVDVRLRVLKGFNAAHRGGRFSDADKRTLLNGGGSTLKAASDGSLMIERIVTTRTKNDSGFADSTLYPARTGRLFYAIAYDIQRHFSTKYSQAKMSKDPNFNPPGQVVLNPVTARAEFSGLFLKWRDQYGWVENYDQFMSELDIDMVDDTLVALLPTDFVNNFINGKGLLSLR